MNRKVPLILLGLGYGGRGFVRNDGRRSAHRGWWYVGGAVDSVDSVVVAVIGVCGDSSPILYEDVGWVDQWEQYSNLSKSQEHKDMYV